MYPFLFDMSDTNFIIDIVFAYCIKAGNRFRNTSLYLHDCNFLNLYDGNQNSRIHCIQYGWLLEYFLEPSFQSMNLTGKNVMVRLLEYEP